MGRRLLTTLIVAAHPDDEVLGAGIWMHRRKGRSIHILHITDGSPKDMQDARAHGFHSRKSYAKARQQELMRALNKVPVPAANCTRLQVPDKEAYLNLPAVISQLEELILRLKPAQVLSPAYEGGHPDHDAAAFATSVVRKRTEAFEHWEFPLYHASTRGRMTTGKFIADRTRVEKVLSFSDPERALKADMLACFTTQQGILGHFRLDCERFRRAPAYDFAKPPHAGRLLYEQWEWGITGAQWRQRAGEILT